MRVECEKLSERVATPELIRELVRDGKRPLLGAVPEGRQPSFAHGCGGQG